MKELHTKFEKKLKEREISDLEYWKAHLDKLISMKPEGIAALQLQIRKVTDMMENRIKLLKKA
jgi:coproporphyrinogen III oxidase-like Fe-S oxidoreductase